MEIRDLSCSYSVPAGMIKAVDKVSITLEHNTVMGVVGESGCGKTTLAKAILGLLATHGEVVTGEILFEGKNLVELSQEEFRSMRWRLLSYIPQNALAALDPLFTVGTQIVETVTAHSDIDRKEATAKAEELLDQVEVGRANVSTYPHQLSGGMKQRVCIAMALSLEPKLIVADEPTTALDTVTQARVIKLIRDFQEKMRFSVLFITHDLALATATCNKIAVMYAGQIVESGESREIIRNSLHPYTMGISRAILRVSRSSSPIFIPGQPPNLLKPPVGCRFHTRCPFATKLCAEEDPPLQEVQPNHYVACHYADRAEEFRKESKNQRVWSRSMA